MILKQDFEEAIGSIDVDYEKMTPKEAIDFLDKSGDTLKLAMEYFSKAAAILFVGDKILSMKWYSVNGLIRIYKLGKLFIEMTEKFYLIWKKKKMSKIVEVAQKEIGTAESPKNSNRTKYGEWFGLQGQPWCAIFVSWVYFYANKKLPNIGFKLGFAGCQTGFVYFKKNGWITKDPVPGDIVLFDWNLDGRYDHTGIFVKWIDKENFETVEGNTSLKNQSNGGNVMSRKRNIKNSIFVHPIL